MSFGDIPMSEFNRQIVDYNQVQNELSVISSNIKEIMERQGRFNTETERRLERLENAVESNPKKIKDNTTQIAASLGLIGIGAIILFKEIRK